MPDGLAEAGRGPSSVAAAKGIAPLATWLSRLSVGLVFVLNVSCALAFIFRPEAYSGGFETTGVPGKVAVQGFGILFLMWNATYPPVLLWPDRQRTLFAIVLIQQAIGVAGETWLWSGLPAGHAVLRATGLRFLVFDAAGLVLMVAAYWFLTARIGWRIPASEEAG